ncbi:MAG: hypothetical protein KF862_00760 [Chitinophagaceae bacterium]|nr:hypothetical protein [Chitinophagaceae bacterium]
MCKTTNRATHTASPAEKDLIEIEKVVPAQPPPGLFPPAHTILSANADTASPFFTAFAAVKAKSKYRSLPFAVIDYTNAASPLYLGNNDKKPFFVASLAKIGALFAALWLRKTARANIRKSAASTFAEALEELKAKWTLEEKPFPDRFKKNVIPSATWPPKLEDIFTGNKLPNGDWTLDFTADLPFKGPDRAGSLEVLKPIDKMPEGSTATKKAKRTRINGLGFRDRLELMIGWSSNLAAASCINALGYQFINGCLESAGFYNRNKTTGGGLWLSRNYDGLFDGSDFQGKTQQGATAQAAANCMWLAAAKQLIDVEASEDWLLMMDKETYTDKPAPVPVFTRSFIGDELVKQGLLLKELNSKIGIYYKTTKDSGGNEIYSDFHYSDVANVEESDPAKGLLKYVIAICFSGSTDNDAKVLFDLSFELEKAVKA